MYVRMTFVVPVEIVDQCKALAEAIAGDSGYGMFETPLSPTGQAPATHMVSSGLVLTELADVLGSAASLYAAAANAGIEVTQQEVNAIYSAATISDADPLIVLDSLNLQIVSE